MKKGLIYLACMLLCMPAMALNYCQTSAWGYGKSATGGGSAKPTLVSNYSSLKSAMQTGNKVIVITQSITFSAAIECSKSNLTITALPGVELIAADKNIGIFSFGNCSNIIIRNIAFIGKGSDTLQKGDAMTFNGVKNAWVDHCIFQDGSDGNFDIVGLSDNVTVSWCRFRYTLGGEHCFTNLIGSSSSQAPADGTYNITFAYCWWDHGCQQRMARSRNASLHYLNCYWNSKNAMYYIGPENTDCYVEGCYFEGAPDKKNIFRAEYGGVNGVMAVDSYSSVGFPTVTGREVQIPTYTYEKVTYKMAKTMVTNTTCGAGPTLQVTTDALISSSCDTIPDPPGPPAPPTPSTSGELTWNFSDAQFSSLGTLTSATTIDNLYISANESKTVTVYAANEKYTDDNETLSFTHQQKLAGGQPNNYYRFDVTSACYIDLYCKSSSASADRTVNCSATKLDNVIAQIDGIGGNQIFKATFTYSGPATSIFLASNNSGLFCYGIRVTPITSTGILSAIESGNSTRKIVKNGTLVISREGRLYNLQGQAIAE